MKKFGIIAILLLALAGGGVGVAHFVIDGFADDVTVAETVLSGDKSAAEGITVTTKIDYLQSMLHWETSHTIGSENTTNCQFNYQENDDTYAGSIQNYFMIEPYTDISWSSNFEGNWYNVSGPPKEMLQAIIDKTPAGQSYTETVKLSDYQKYYKISFYGDSADKEKTFLLKQKYISKYFQLPVSDQDLWQVYVEKDDENNLEKITAVRVNSIQFDESISIIGEYAYIIISGLHYTPILDVNQFEYFSLPLPEGWCGVHRVPLTITKETQTNYADSSLEDYTALADFSKAEMVYPMKEGTNIIHSMSSPDGKDLLLFSEEDGKFYMTAVNLETMETKETLFLIDSETRFSPESQFDYEGTFLTKDNYIVAKFDENMICVIEKNKNAYQLKVADTLEIPNLLVGFSERYADFKLAEDKFYIACLYPKPTTEKAYGSSYYLLVYENGKCSYIGAYENSLDYASEITEDSPRTEAIVNNPITISLPSAP